MTMQYSGTQVTFPDASTQNTSPYVGGLAFRNRIINGSCVIDQRNAGASVTPTIDGAYTLDRWQFSLSVASKFSSQQSSTAPAGFINSNLITSLSAYSVPSNGYFMFNQAIEGLNVADLGWGTANAQTVTLSFWVRSSLTGTFGGAIQNSSQSRAYPYSYTINSANTWEQKSITIAGDTTGTWLTTNGVGMFVRFGLGVGSSFSTTAGSWTAGQYFSATGATSVVGTSGATFYITGVQLEKGSTATSFDYRPYGTELALCERYYQTSYPYGTAIQAATGVTDGVSFVSINTSDSINGGLLPVTMRATPTFAIYSTLGGVGSPSARDNVSGSNITGITLTGGTTTNLPRLSKTAGLPVTGGSSSAQYTASAEL